MGMPTDILLRMVESNETNTHFAASVSVPVLTISRSNPITPTISPRMVRIKNLAKIPILSDL